MLYLLSRVSESPDETEINELVEDIEDTEQRAALVRLLTDDTARAALKELISAA